jgi:hypothetical protein
MTEEEWLACTDPGEMIKFLADRISRRKLRWFALACCRRLWEHRKDEQVRKALDGAERYADGLIADSTAYRWYLRANRGKRATDPSRPWEVHACNAVAVAALPDTHGRTLESHFYVAVALADRTTGRSGQMWEPDWRAAERAALRDLVPLLRDIAGDPFHPVAVDPAWLAWDSGVVVRLAQAAYDNPVLPAGTLDNARLAILADALEEAGCQDESIRGHCRSGGEHVRGCWVLDAIMNKT